MGGIRRAMPGDREDPASLFHIYRFCSFLPLIALPAGFLPDLETVKRRRTAPKGFTGK
jgi:hypothetical protein